MANSRENAYQVSLLEGARSGDTGRGTFRASWIVLALAMPCASCSGRPERQPVFPVQGHVYVGGQPAEHALVVFHPLNGSAAALVRPQGVVGRDGSFTLATYTRDDGAPEGEFAVTVTWHYPVIGSDEDEDEATTADLLGGRYADYRTTPLRATITREQHILPPFHLER